MTRYHGGQGRMSGKGRKLPMGFLKRLSSRQRQGKCFRWRPSMCKSRDKKWDGIVGQLAGCKASHSPHLYPCSQCQPVSLYIRHHLPQETITAAQQSQFMSLVRSTHPPPRPKPLFHVVLSSLQYFLPYFQSQLRNE